MMMSQIRSIFGVVVVTSLLGVGTVTADGDDSGQSEMPEAVAELVNAMSGVQRVEPLGDDTFAVHRQMVVTGSRIPREVVLQVAKDGTVVDWGRTPNFSRTYTYRELRRTGRGDLAEALIKLDPAIQRGGAGL